MSKLNKTTMWVIVGLVIFFGGWVIKDMDFGKDIGKAFMSMGFVILGVVIGVTIAKDVHK